MTRIPIFLEDHVVLFELDWNYYPPEENTWTTPGVDSDVELINIYCPEQAKYYEQEELDLLYAVGEGDGSGLNWKDMEEKAIKEIEQNLVDAKYERKIDELEYGKI